MSDLLGSKVIVISGSSGIGGASVFAGQRRGDEVCALSRPHCFTRARRGPAVPGAGARVARGARALASVRGALQPPRLGCPACDARRRLPARSRVSRRAARQGRRGVLCTLRSFATFATSRTSRKRSPRGARRSRLQRRTPPEVRRCNGPQAGKAGRSRRAIVSTTMRRSCARSCVWSRCGKWSSVTPSPSSSSNSEASCRTCVNAWRAPAV